MDFRILGSRAENLVAFEPIADCLTRNEQVFDTLVLLRWKTKGRVVFFGNLLAGHRFGRIMASWKCGEELALQKYMNITLMHP